MPQSLAELYVHLVFSTHDRTPFLHDESALSKMHAYLTGTSKKLGYPVLTVGGVADHVHVLARFGKDVRLVDWVRDLKRSSTNWIREDQPDLKAFSWQEGYGAFSTDATRIPVLRRYIERQADHHRRFDFKDEFRKICKQCNVELDEKYAWG